MSTRVQPTIARRTIVYVYDERAPPHVRAEANAICAHRQKTGDGSSDYRCVALGDLGELLATRSLATVELAFLAGAGYTPATHTRRRYAKRVAATRLVDVVAEARHYNRADAYRDVCERHAPCTLANLCGGGAWYPRLRELAVAPLESDGSGGWRLVVPVVHGRPGCGKTSAAVLLALDLDAQLVALSPLACGSEESARPIATISSTMPGRARDAAMLNHARSAAERFYRGVTQRAHTRRRPRLLIVLDDAESASVGGARLFECLTRVRTLAVALRDVADMGVVVLAHDWYARNDFVCAMRTRKTSAARFVPLAVPRVDDATLERHLARVIPHADAVVRAAVAGEADGDVRAAMVRLDFAARVRGAVKCGGGGGEKVRWRSESLANRLRTLAREHTPRTGERRATSAGFIARIEREFPTVDAVATARDLLHENYLAMMPRARSDADEEAQLNAAANLLELQSFGDTMREQQLRTGYAGDDAVDGSLRLQTALSVGAPLALLGSSGLAHGTRYLSMRFADTRQRTTARRRAASVTAASHTARAGSTRRLAALDHTPTLDDAADDARANTGTAPMQRDMLVYTLPSSGSLIGARWQAECAPHRMLGAQQTALSDEVLDRASALGAREPVVAARVGVSESEYGALAHYSDSRRRLVDPRASVRSEAVARTAYRRALKANPVAALPRHDAAADIVREKVRVPAAAAKTTKRRTAAVVAKKPFKRARQKRQQTLRAMLV